MSMSISDGIKEEKISFNKNSILTVAGETINTGETYKVGTDIINKKCDYLKVVGNISVSDESLTTDEFHPVVIMFEIKYEDEDGNHSLIYEHFYPKYQHEVGNKDTYTIIELKNKKLVDINVSVINNEDYTDSVVIDKLQIFYSLIIDEETVQEMIATGGGGEVPVVKDLKVYNIDNNYTIDGYGKSLILDLVVPEEYLIEYKSGSQNIVDVTWEIENLTGAVYSYSGVITYTVVNGIQYTLRNGKITITSGISSYNYGQKDGIIKVRARLSANETIFGDVVVEVVNSEVTDFYIKSISSEDGKLHTAEDVTIELGFKPEKSSKSITGKFILQSYDGKGEANNVYGSNTYGAGSDGLGNNFTLRGVSQGKVSLYLGNDDLHKQFIFDVIKDETPVSDVYWPEFPDDKAYFCIFREKERSGATANRIEMGTFNCDGDASITVSVGTYGNAIAVNNLSGKINQYYLDLDNNTWNLIGEWTGISDNSSELLYYNTELASNTTSLDNGTKLDSYEPLLTTLRPES